MIDKNKKFKNLIKIATFLTLLLIGTAISGNCVLAQPTLGGESGIASAATTETLSTITPGLYKSVTFYTLLFILVCFFIGLIGRILKIYELTREIQGKKSQINWNQIQSVLWGIILIIGLYAVYWTFNTWGYSVMSESGSEHGVRIDFMMIVTIFITGFVFIITHILLFGFSLKYRGSDKRKAYFYPHNNAIERLWTIAPAITLTVLVLLGFFTWRSITNVPENEQKRAINIEVVGEQFKWTVRYAGTDNKLGLRNYKLTTPMNGLGIDFAKKESHDDKLAGEIVIPKGRPVRFTIASKDIIHSFYIPTMRTQMNAVPGMNTYFQLTPRLTTKEMREKSNDSTFDYVLLCNKICGSGHYNMQVNVRVVTEKEYREWLTKQSLFFNDDIKREFQVARTGFPGKQ